MKILNVAAIVAVTAAAALGSAQGRPPMGRPPMGGPGMGGPGGGGRSRDPKEQAERQTQMMTQMLGLNAAQQAKVKAIILKSALEMKHVRDAQLASLNKVLTADQQKKLASMRGPGGGMRGGPGGGMRRGG